MEKKHGPWTIVGSEPKYQHRLIQVREDQVIKPDGTRGAYTTVKVKAGVSVLAMDDDQSVYLAKEFRYALGRHSIEAVGGALEDDEPPVEAARRELKEELGIEADQWVELGRVDPITSIIDSPSTLFLARGLSFREKKNHGSERIETVRVSLGEAMRMVINSEITHGTSGVLIFRANAYLNRR